MIFEGNRYVVTRGTIDFANPARHRAVLRLEAETRIRVAGQSQTYRVTLGFTGTAAKMTMNLNSDPPLPSVGILLLLLGQTSDLQDAELRTLNPRRDVADRKQDLLKAATARLLTAAMSAPVESRRRAVARASDLQITPSIGDRKPTR